MLFLSTVNRHVAAQLVGDQTQLMLHRSSETTRRYIFGAVLDVLQWAVDAIDEGLSAGSTGW